jgi:hypothetical protein
MSADPAARPPRLPVPVVLPPARRPATPPGLALPPVLPAPPAPSPARSESPAAPPGQRAPHVTWWAWALAAATVVGHVAVNRASPYGVHRDELLYLAMGEHLQLWRMDFPPFMALAAELTRALVGDARVAGSVAALRLGPALAAGALVLLAALLAREFGGRRGPQFLAAGAVACSPMFLRTGTLFQPVVFDQLWWTLGFLALVRLGRHADEGARPWAPRRLTPASLEIVPGDRADRRASDVPRRWWRARDARDWLVLGAAGGLGLLTKFSIAFFAAGVLAGVLATPLRRRLRTPAPWAAAALALALGAPSVVGQLRLGWPVAGQMAHLQATQLARVGPAGFFLDQLPHGPGLLLALLGLVALLASFRRPEPPALASLRAGRPASPPWPPCSCSPPAAASRTTPGRCTRCSGRPGPSRWARAGGRRTPSRRGPTGRRARGSPARRRSSARTARRRSPSASRCSPPPRWPATPRRPAWAPRRTPAGASPSRRTTPTCSAGPSWPPPPPTRGGRSRPRRASAPRSSPATTARPARSPSTGRASGCRPS